MNDRLPPHEWDTDGSREVIHRLATHVFAEIASRGHGHPERVDQSLLRLKRAIATAEIRQGTSRAS